MNRSWSKIVIIGLLCAGVPLLAPADKVVLKSGMALEGRAEDVFGKPTKLAIMSSTGRLEINRTLVQRIEETSDAEDYTIIGNQLLSNGAYEDSIQMFQQALEYDADHRDAKQGLESARGGIQNRQAQQLLELRNENTSLLENARESIAQHQFLEVEKIIKTLEERQPTPQQQQELELLKRDLYLAWGMERLDKLDRNGAERYLQMVLKMDPENRQANQTLLQIWEKNPNRRAEVAEAYEKQLRDAPNDVELNRKLADLYIVMNQPEKAIPPLMKFMDTPTFRSRGYDSQLKSAISDAAYKRVEQGDLTSAVEIMKQQQELFPGSDDTELKLLEYRLAKQKVPNDDYEAQAELLTSLVANGLKTTAIRDAEYIMRQDPENKKAMSIIREYAEKELLEIESIFQEGEFTLSANMAARYGDRYASKFPKLVQQASDLYDKAQFEAARQQKENREQARDVAALGDQYFAEARRYVELYKSADNPNRSSVISYKSEAIRYLNRATEAYQTALGIDPSLGKLVGGLDVDSKLADAQALYRSLNRRAPTINRPQTINDY